MFMRVTRFTSSTPLDDKRIADGGQRLSEAFGKIPGYLGASALLDRASGEAASITYWADAASLQASQEAGNAVRTQAAGGGLNIRDVRHYERVIQEYAGTPRVGVFARVTNFTVAPGRVDELLAHMKAVSVPQAKALPGFQSFLVSVDRATGLIGVASVWESEAAREASLAGVGEERRQTIERFGATLDDSQSYEVVALNVTLPAPA
ncbi:MAG: antibiotic biosynthesis monooxygenase [Chloroflexi bacterium]|nr:antibiotic biosynthesis monooxygenase [Chloroflexota bacterium]